MSGQSVEVSVVIPLLNEQDNIRALYNQLTQALGNKYQYELIFIDDGSTDASFGILAELHKADEQGQGYPFPQELWPDGRSQCRLCSFAGPDSHCHRLRPAKRPR